MTPMQRQTAVGWAPEWRLDPVLTGLLLAVMTIGLAVLYSAGERDVGLVVRQLVRFGVGLTILVIATQLPPNLYRNWSAWLYIGALALLVAVTWFGVGRGAQRWLDLGIVRFQPSEVMKLAVPMMAAAWLHPRPMPPTFGTVCIALGIILVPVALIARQPDLGTALLVGAGGLGVLFLAGLRKRYMFGMAVLLTAAIPLAWLNLLDYQKNRILTFLNPESDPLGQGWNIIQSKIAVGSGGLTGKGWLAGSQSHLEFLPEPHTDFAFSVLAEEFGFAGVVVVLTLYLAIITRALYLAGQCRDSFSRMLAGSLVVLFFLYVVVNAGMVSGLLPVVGVPLPLISYGGTSAVTILASFGIIMGLYSRRRFMS